MYGRPYSEQGYMKKVSVVVGTRPEVIKMAPLVRALQRIKAPFAILHTGQHYSYNMDRVFFEQLDLPRPTRNLEVGSGSQAGQTARILVGAEAAFIEDRPDIVLVEGDTNSVLAAALAACKLHIPVGHVEAGLRSHDSSMPEEINRILTDHCSDYLFAPTEGSAAALLAEGIPQSRIFVTGNTIVDAVFQNVDLAAQRSTVLETLGLQVGGYFLVTLHRRENVDDAARFRSILDGLEAVAAEYRLPLLYPVHPHSRRRMEELALAPAHVRLIDPVDFLDFLQLEKGARLILTDSGGVQEEGCILGVPCVTIRDNTERPETVEVGANVLAGTAPQRILECCREMLGKQGGWHNPFGDGKAAERIVSIVMEDKHG